MKCSYHLGQRGDLETKIHTQEYKQGASQLYGVLSPTRSIGSTILNLLGAKCWNIFLTSSFIQKYIQNLSFFLHASHISFVCFHCFIFICLNLLIHLSLLPVSYKLLRREVALIPYQQFFLTKTVSSQMDRNIVAQRPSQTFKTI